MFELTLVIEEPIADTDKVIQATMRRKLECPISTIMAAVQYTCEEIGWQDIVSVSVTKCE